MAKILCIDDDALTLKLVKHILEKVGHQVQTHRHASDAVAFALGWDPDLFTIDLMMPDAPGGAVIESIRQHPKLKAKRIVIVSGQENPAVIKPLLMRGADGYCAKIEAQDKLPEVVSAVLAGKRDAAFPSVPLGVDDQGDLTPPRFYMIDQRGVIEFHGELDEKTESSLAGHVDLAYALARDLILDITDTDKIHKKGVESVSRLLQASRARRRHAVIVASGEQEYQLRDLGLDLGADIFYTIDDAVRFLK